MKAAELLDVTNEELLARAQKADRLLEEFADGLTAGDPIEREIAQRNIDAVQGQRELIRAEVQARHALGRLV